MTNQIVQALHTTLKPEKPAASESALNSAAVLSCPPGCISMVLSSLDAYIEDMLVSGASGSKTSSTITFPLLGRAA